MAFKDFMKEFGQVLWESLKERAAKERADYEKGIDRYQNMTNEQLAREYKYHKSNITKNIGNATAFKEVYNQRKAEYDSSHSQ